MPRGLALPSSPPEGCAPRIAAPRSSVWLCCLLLAGCTCTELKGSGHNMTETRNVAGFTELHASGALRLIVALGEPLKVDVSADDNLLPYVETVADGKRLEVRTKPGVRPSETLTVIVSAPQLERVSASGAAQVTLSGVASETFDFAISGAGKAKLTGLAQILLLRLEGTAIVDAEELQAEEVRIRSTGATRAAIWATRALDVKLAGAGLVTYRGTPEVTRAITGAGEVRPR